MDNTVRSNYIDNLCALLGINDKSRVKIVGIRTGSSIVDVSITDANANNPSPSPSEPSLAQVNTDLTNAIQNDNLGAALEPGIGANTFISASSVLNLLPNGNNN